MAPIPCQDLLSNFIREDRVQEGTGNRLSDGLRGGKERAGPIAIPCFAQNEAVWRWLRLHNLKAATSFVP